VVPYETMGLDGWPTSIGLVLASGLYTIAAIPQKWISTERAMTTTPMIESTGRGGPQLLGPSLQAVAIVFVALFVASIVVTAIMTGGGHFPSPFEPRATATTFFSDHADAVRASAFLQFGAAVPLGIFTATSTSRLRFLGVQAAGASIALVGGTLASAMTALSALLQWTLAQPGIAASEGVVHALHLLSFATGGPGYVGPFGILVAGVSLSGGIPRHLPRWVMWFGLVISGIAELSSLTILTPEAAYLLPAARFTGFVWLIAAGATLPSRRGARATPKTGAPLRAVEDQPQS
jgi:hypothetical protein